VPLTQQKKREVVILNVKKKGNKKEKAIFVRQK
jgi:hypothetical protein